MQEEDPVVVVLATFPEAESAREIAGRLVEERLAACVNLVPGVESVFRWDGKVDSATEILAVIKTTPGRADALQQRLVELHPYDVPEALRLPVTAGHPAYLEWIGESVES